MKTQVTEAVVTAYRGHPIQCIEAADKLVWIGDGKTAPFTLTSPGRMIFAARTSFGVCFGLDSNTVYNDAKSQIDANLGPVMNSSL